MKSSMGKYLQMGMLDASDRYHAESGYSKRNTNKVSIMPISFGWIPISLLSFGTFYSA